MNLNSHFKHNPSSFTPKSLFTANNQPLTNKAQIPKNNFTPLLKQPYQFIANKSNPTPEMRSYLNSVAEHHGSGLLSVETNVFLVQFQKVMEASQVKEQFRVKIMDDQQFVSKCFESLDYLKQSYQKFLESYVWQDEYARPYLNLNAKYDESQSELKRWKEWGDAELATLKKENEALRDRVLLIDEIKNQELSNARIKNYQDKINKLKDELFKKSISYDVAVRESQWKNKSKK